MNDSSSKHERCEANSVEIALLNLASPGGLECRVNVFLLLLIVVSVEFY